MSSKKTVFLTIEGKSLGFYFLLGLFAFMVLAGLGASYYMEHHGHVVTGMNNQIVWGMPHVFAVFLIVAASGALNVASISSAFGKVAYKPLARLSALLAIALLVGGLIVLVLDLGRPDRLIVAMTRYNFKSIFAWNIYLYIGFMGVVAAYLWMMFEQKMNRFTSAVGTFAFIWRFVLTTGTGSIFGFIVAREAYDAALLAPTFVIMSLSFGTAIFILILHSIYSMTGRELGDQLINRLRNLLSIFVAAVFYMTLVFHLTNLYGTQHHGVERFLLLEGGIFTQVFWIGQIGIGTLAPLALFWLPGLNKTRGSILLGSLMVVIGGLSQIFVIIIGAQAYPLTLFPGKTVSSGFFDGVVNTYSPSLPEWVLGISGFGIALLATQVAIRVLPFLPERLSDTQAES